MSHCLSSEPNLLISLGMFYMLLCRDSPLGSPNVRFCASTFPSFFKWRVQKRTSQGSISRSDPESLLKEVPISTGPVKQRAGIRRKRGVSLPAFPAASLALPSRHGGSVTRTPAHPLSWFSTYADKTCYLQLASLQTKTFAFNLHFRKKIIKNYKKKIQSI